MKTFYEMLDVGRTASDDEIKRAFRREIAKYHPDKVQHLGSEFQEIAAVKAADLTRAYKTLTDETLRAEYDAEIDSGVQAAPVHHAPSSQTPSSDSPPLEPDVIAPAPERASIPDPSPPAGASVFSQDRAGASDIVQKATVMRFRQALDGEFNSYEEQRLQGFEFACVPKPPFWKLKLPPRVLGRFVSHVSGPAIAETWALAARMKKDSQRDLCVFVMGPAVAPPGELARAIAEQRRRPMLAGGTLFMVPVDTRTWSAHVPNDAPPVVKSLLTRLKAI